MKKHGLWAFLVCCLCLATMSVLFGGCGNNGFGQDQDPTEATFDLAQGPQEKTIVLKDFDTGETYQLNVGAGHDRVLNRARGYLNGRGIVPETITSNADIWYDSYAGKYVMSVAFYLEGSFVASGGNITEAMADMLQGPDYASGNSYAYSMDQVESGPGCNQEVEYCGPMFVSDPLYSANWYGNPSFNQNDWDDEDGTHHTDYYAYVDMNLWVNAVVLQSANIWIEQNSWVDPAERPIDWRPWRIGVSFQGFIDPDQYQYEAPEAPIPCVCNEGEPCDCGDGKG